MRKNAISFLLTVPVSGIIVLTACSKPAEPAAPSATQTQPPSAAVENAKKEGVTVTAEVQKQATEAKPATETAANEVAKASETVKPAETTATPPPAPPAAASASTQVSDTFTRVKTLMSEKKYPEALAALAELSNAVLTPEQQTTVTQLKAQIQSMMASDAGKEGLKAVNNLLNQKK